MISDLRHALRSLLKNPAFSIVALITLALGIGANTSVFSVVNATILRRLPYPQPERLMLPRLTIQREPGRREPMPWSYPKFELFRSENRDFAQLAAFYAANMTLTEGEAERVRGEEVSAPYFSILGLRPALGRFFAASEDAVAGRNPVVVLGYGLWQRRFGGSNVLGRTISLNDVPLTVIGVAPRGFEGLNGPVELWVPMMMAPRLAYPEVLEEPQSHWFQVVARLKPDVPASRATSDMAIIGTRIAKSFPTSQNAWSADAITLDEARSDPGLRNALFILLGGVGFVLLIACVNVANLMIARAATRRREIGVRLALGAGHGRLIRQLFFESLLLATAAGVFSILLALWTTRALSSISPERTAAWGIQSAELLDLRSIGIDLRVLAFTFGIALLSAVLFGLAPAILAARSGVSQLLRSTAETAPGRFRWNGRLLLVSAEVAIALVLLVGAGLLGRSFVRLVRIDAGFQPENVLTLRIQPSSNAYDRRTATELHRNLLDRIAAIPGVSAVGVDKCAPLSSACSDSVVLQVDGIRPLKGTEPEIGVHWASPGTFRALGIPLIEGREFNDRDSGDAPHRVIINRRAAERLWPGKDPIGRQIAVAVGYFFDNKTTVPATVIGVVGDVRYGRPEELARPDVYIPDLQATTPATFLFVKSASTTAALLPFIRREIENVDPKIPIFDVRWMSERAGDATSRTRYAALLLGCFSALALLLALVGVYAVVAALTRERMREIGIRMALGASAASVQRRVVGSAFRVALAGAIAGLGAALLLTRVFNPFLFGVSARDPLTFATVAVVLVGGAAFASYLPARRASLIDPVAVLRGDA